MFLSSALSRRPTLFSQQYHGTIKLSFILIVWLYSKAFGREIKRFSGLRKAEVDIFKSKLFAQVVLCSQAKCKLPDFNIHTVTNLSNNYCSDKYCSV